MIDAIMHDEHRNSEKLTDESDMASRAEARLVLDALEAQRKRMIVKLDPDFDGVHCVECGDEIPAERLEATRTDKCIACQKEIDHRNRLFMH